MDPTRRFSNRAENYRRYRPSYPLAAVDLIQRTANLSPGDAVVDAGSGTGIFTRLLLEAGLTVSAVEPNEAMRQAAEEDLAALPGFQSVAAAAEETGLPAAAFPVLTTAQAFHWFDRERVALEFRRILRPGGWVFVIWNERKARNSPFNHVYQDLLASLGHEFAGIRNKRDEDTMAMEVFFAPGTYQVVHFDNPHILTWEQLRGRFLSSSYAPTEEDPRYPELAKRLEDMFRTHEVDGKIEFEQETGVYFGQMDAS